jgi:hypothetical protein
MLKINSAGHHLQLLKKAKTVQAVIWEFIDNFKKFVVYSLHDKKLVDSTSVVLRRLKYTKIVGGWGLPQTPKGCLQRSPAGMWEGHQDCMSSASPGSLLRPFSSHMEVFWGLILHPCKTYETFHTSPTRRFKPN